MIPTLIHRAAGFLVLACLASPAASAASLSLSVADIAAAGFSACGIVLSLPQDGSAELQVAQLRVQQRELHAVQLRCARFELSSAGMRCSGGTSRQLPGATLEFSYRFANQAWQFSAKLNHASAQALGALFSTQSMPQLTQGRLDGSVQASGDAAGAHGFGADLRLADVGFGDDSGLHAAEKLGGTVRLKAERRAGEWRWQSDVVWQSGELFWQPLYLGGAGERRLSASGTLDGAMFKVERGEADLPQIGKLNFAFSRDGEKVREASAQGENLDVKRLYADYARPFFDKSALSEAKLSGHADVDWHYRDGATQALHLALRDVDVADGAGRFGLHGVNTVFDWAPDAQRSAHVAIGGGELLGMPLGEAQWTVRMRGFDFDVAQADLPVLDGKLALRDFRLRREGDDWRWQFGAALSRISMERFSQAVGWPKMLGTLAGRIPRVSYDGREIVVEGALMFDVFDGTVVASKLKLVEPFGRAPRLYGNLNMRELDLDLLTRTFSFGNMLGRIDVDVNDLELQDWQPARFDARIASSAGSYPKKISQKAVQNISSLGGVGAMAAIQNSYLRFFESFGYDRIGWRCKLRNGVCAMGGVDEGDGSPYAIIEGGGIPAITVMGYNRDVSWSELISRLKRVTQKNVRPVVQ